MFRGLRRRDESGFDIDDELSPWEDDSLESAGKSGEQHAVARAPAAGDEPMDELDHALAFGDDFDELEIDDDPTTRRRFTGISGRRVLALGALAVCCGLLIVALRTPTEPAPQASQDRAPRPRKVAAPPAVVASAQVEADSADAVAARERRASAQRRAREARRERVAERRRFARRPARAERGRRRRSAARRSTPTRVVSAAQPSGTPQAPRPAPAPPRPAPETRRAPPARPAASTPSRTNDEFGFER